MYLVDTNVISEARRGTREAVAWLRSAKASTIYLSVLTLGEITKGVAMKERVDRRAADNLAEWLQKLRRDHADRILAVTGDITMEWGRIAALRPRGDVDGLIAATAIVHGLILVTRNIADFDDISVSIVNLWDRG
ncbi:MAG: type II toxin-antitoxin system VapC family toxin [Beijerinckiaceae bacterium]